MELIANKGLCSQPARSTQTDGPSPRMKKEAEIDRPTFVSTLAHRAQSQSPQKQKQNALEQAGFNVSKNRTSSSAVYNHSPYDSGDNERSYRVVSTTIPQKRKSQSTNASDLGKITNNDHSFRLTQPNGVDSSSEGPSRPSAKVLGKRPMVVLQTPSPKPQLPPQDSVSVVIPSPSATQREQLRASLKPEFKGLDERYFPTGQEEKAKAKLRAYPTMKTITAAANKKAVPFAITMPFAKDPRHKKPSGPFSLQRSVSSNASPPKSVSAEPTTQESIAKFLRKKLRKKLKRTPGGPDTNFDIDDEKLAALSANFSFVGDYRLGPGVTPVDNAFLTGCDCGSVCDPNTCHCLIQEEDSDRLIVAYERLSSGKVVVRQDFLNRKAMISECSDRCQCAGNDCWNHVVQRGRQVRLEVFDTGERGLGLRCVQPLIKGEFIDCYFGEVITQTDADARESANEGKPSYLFNLDWLIENGPHEYEEGYVIDGQKFGAATRFINHSCNPNCKIIPVSINNLSDDRLYYLAFFAIRDIPAKTELTFDYHPNWDGSKKIDPNAVKCLCGGKNCRGQLWPNSRKKERQL
ncbi:Histone-lysine N-methyltransferase, H3 lysine-9 specific [Penicillium rolfsii]|nr:Histone-lysine N-methyltransferase, H3 lysine-9 specific [Penicillium rolfsii]